MFMTHILKELRVMSFATLHKIVDPQGMNFDDVGILGPRQVFVHVQLIDFVTIVAGKDIYIIIAMRNLTQEFHDKTVPVEAVIFMGNKVDLVATVLVIIREIDVAPVALANRAVMGANLNENICSQISPADASLVDKKAFDATCSAD